MKSRREFLGAMSAWSAVTGLHSCCPAWAAQTSGRLVVDGEHVVANVPQDFPGLSFESAQLIHPGFLSARNTRLVSLVRQLGSQGVLRIGGNTSAFTTWTTDLGDVSDGRTYGPDRGGDSKETLRAGQFRITPTAIHELNSFLEATGWQLLYGLNLRNGTPVTATEEAAYVANVCGHQLLALQLGNEVDLFKFPAQGNATDVEKRWTYGQFWKQWQAMYQAVRARLPQVAVAGPDSAFEPEWPAKFAQGAQNLVSMITSHYYAGGPPSDPKMTLDFLLHAEEHLQKPIFEPLKEAQAVGLPYRMSEGNSCYNGGKDGVSNVFGSALWAADFMLILAQHGVAGVNFHGGGNGMYTPIAGPGPSELVARPDYYGMLLGGQFAGSKMLATQLDAGGANVTAYAAHQGGSLQLAVLNKSESEVSLSLSGTPGIEKARAWLLVAPSLSSKSDITFGGTSVATDGKWTLGPGNRLNAGPLHLQAYSAVLLRWIL